MKIKRALISVFDKTGIVDFAKALLDNGTEIISSGGSYSALKESGLAVTKVEDITNFAECLDGRVKTLHPNIHAGILANRNLPEHMQAIAALNIAPIDLVVVNLYPFGQVISDPSHTLAQAIENIDIGGPSLIRGAAKNNTGVSVITDPSDYSSYIAALKTDGITKELNFELAKKAFLHTAQYDKTIANYLYGLGDNADYPQRLELTLTKKQSLRYGENPHQSAAFYVGENPTDYGIESAVLLHGKELSYNNINDTQGAIDLTMEFLEPAVIAVKHATPCGVAVSSSIATAFKKAYDADPVSIFGGIVCLNREVDLETATMMSEIFLEVVVAPSYASDAFALLTKKRDIRLMTLAGLNAPKVTPTMTFKSVGGGAIFQQSDTGSPTEYKVVTKTSPTQEQLSDIEFGEKIVKHVKSNAVVVVKGGVTLGIGGGEVSRIWATQAALARAGNASKGAVVASDAFFPFPDVVEECTKAGITAIVQPGGSKNDNLSVEECDKNGISMVFTNTRHFRH